MKSMILITRCLFVVPALAVALSGGCSNVVSVQQTPLSGGQVLPHRAALALDQEFTGYTYPMALVGGTDMYPMGAALQGYAQNVTSKSFQQVDVVPSAEQGASLNSDDSILIPRVVKCDNSIGKWVPFVEGDISTTLVVEWTAKNRATQNTVWLKTITANGTAGWNHKSDMFQKLFDDLNLKTYKAFQEAPELGGTRR